MNSDQVINTLAAVTLVELMLLIGMGASVAKVWEVVRDWRGVVRVFVANYVLVPAVAFALVALFDPAPMIAAGVMVVATCPGAPYAPPMTALAKGRVDLAVGWMVLLAGSSAVLAPLLLTFLLPLATRGAPASVDAVRTVTTLAVAQFLPLCVGMGIAAFDAPWVNRLKVFLARLSLFLNVLLIGVILVAQFHMLSAIRASGYAGMLLLLLGSAVAGWLLGGRDAARRRTLAITTSVRNVGVGLVIAGGSFPGSPAVTFTTAYALFQTVISALVVVAVGKAMAAPNETTAAPTGDVGPDDHPPATAGLPG